MSQANTIARPYAQAAFEAAQKQADLQGWSALLSAAADALANAEVAALISNPKVSAKQVEGLMLQLCEPKNQSQKNFIGVLAEARRFGVVAAIAEMYEALRAEAEKMVQATIISAFVLNDAQQAKIAAALKARMNREIKLSCQVDQSLVGGIVIRMGDKVIDGSVRARLSEIEYALA